MTTSGAPIVLVTGINGYIASSVVKAFLEAGYRVRGTVRSFEKTGPAIYAAFQPSVNSGTLEIVEIPDYGAAGAWDDAVKDVVAIASVAAPDLENVAVINEALSIARANTTALLKAADEHAGTQLKIVILLSSMAALHSNDAGPGYCFSDKDFDPALENMVLGIGDKATKGMKYSAVKVAVEDAFWKFVHSGEKKGSWIGASVNPGFCIGPAVVAPLDPMKLPASVRCVWQIYAGQEWPADFATGIFVDVRDVANAIVFCAQHPEEARTARLLLGTWKGSNQAIADILREAFPDRADIIRKGDPGKDVNPDYVFRKDEIRFDGDKIVAISGREYTPFPQSIIDTGKQFDYWTKEGRGH
jgi:nucleoside-diphosphate-sugar epimerase